MWIYLDWRLPNFDSILKLGLFVYKISISTKHHNNWICILLNLKPPYKNTNAPIKKWVGSVKKHGENKYIKMPCAPIVHPFYLIIHTRNTIPIHTSTVDSTDKRYSTNRCRLNLCSVILWIIREFLHVLEECSLWMRTLEYLSGTHSLYPWTPLSSSLLLD